MNARLLVAALAMMSSPMPGAVRPARAQTQTGEVWSPQPDDPDTGPAGGDRRIRATLSTGLAVALADYETHGIAFPIRVGADFPLFRTGPVRHRLLLAAEHAHFSRAFIREPEVVPGLRLDTASLRATWRVFLFPGRGFYFDAGAGLGVLHDRIHFELLGRRVTSSETRAGLPVEAGLGWTIGRHLDLGLRYSHDVLVFGDASSVLGQLQLALGARL
jgi:hypothetical protein